MSDGHPTPKPSELVYVPGASWAPVLVAVGLVAVLIGLFAGWPYAVAGAVLGLASLRAWVRRTGDETGRLPGQQGLSTAVLPAVPLRSADDGS